MKKIAALFFLFLLCIVLSSQHEMSVFEELELNNDVEMDYQIIDFEVKKYHLTDEAIQAYFGTVRILAFFPSYPTVYQSKIEVEDQGYFFQGTDLIQNQIQFRKWYDQMVEKYYMKKTIFLDGIPLSKVRIYLSQKELQQIRKKVPQIIYQIIA